MDEGQEGIILTFWLRMTATGAVKPTEVLSALTGQFGFPCGEAAFRRTALKAEQNSKVQDPFEI